MVLFIAALSCFLLICFVDCLGLGSFCLFYCWGLVGFVIWGLVVDIVLVLTWVIWIVTLVCGCGFGLYLVCLIVFGGFVFCLVWLWFEYACLLVNCLLVLRFVIYLYCCVFIVVSYWCWLFCFWRWCLVCYFDLPFVLLGWWVLLDRFCLLVGGLLDVCLFCLLGCSLFCY